MSTMWHHFLFLATILTSILAVPQDVVPAPVVTPCLGSGTPPPCGHMDGQCKKHADCEAGLRCGHNNCIIGGPFNKDSDCCELIPGHFVGRWDVIFRQTKDAGFFAKDEWQKNPTNRYAQNFANLKNFEELRGSDGSFHLNLRYQEEQKSNEWQQISNPVTQTDGGVQGYYAVDIDLKEKGWGGLEFNNEASLLDGSVGSSEWWYGVGSMAEGSDQGATAATQDAASKVELFVKVECPEVGVEYPGSDISVSPSLSWKKCSSLCRGEATCSDWSWVKPDSDRLDKGKCHLKNNKPARKLEGDVISGYRTCGRATNPTHWLILGGSTGFEASDEEDVTANMEQLSLTNKHHVMDADSWCQKPLSNLSLPLEGSVAAFMDLTSFLRPIPKEKHPHELFQFDRLVMCGGADDKYVTQAGCRWWKPEEEEWVDGPMMLHPRYHAAAIHVKNGLWILGGRNGNKILKTNEFLPYPSKRNVNSWQIVHEKSSYTFPDLYLGPAMAELPIPLAGHCAVKHPSGFVAVLGGLTEGHVTTNHVHVYSFVGPANRKWVSTADIPAPSNSFLKNLTPMKIGRANHACVMYTENGRKKVMVAGGVSVGEDDRVLNSVEILDFHSGVWVEGKPLPNRMTGGKLLLVEGRIVLVGRYGYEHTNKVITYDTDEKEWKEMPVKLLKGRSDMEIVQVPYKHNNQYSCP